MRHASAENVSVTIQVSAQETSVLVQDDGVGFDAAAVMAGPVEGRFGFLSMEERAKILGGRLTVDSEPGEGAIILVHVPRSRGESDARSS